MRRSIYKCTNCGSIYAKTKISDTSCTCDKCDGESFVLIHDKIEGYIPPMLNYRMQHDLKLAIEDMVSFIINRADPVEQARSFEAVALSLLMMPREQALRELDHTYGTNNNRAKMRFLYDFRTRD